MSRRWLWTGIGALVALPVVFLVVLNLFVNVAW